jgi:putative DNA primase/helicase
VGLDTFRAALEAVKQNVPADRGLLDHAKHEIWGAGERPLADSYGADVLATIYMSIFTESHRALMKNWMLKLSEMKSAATSTLRSISNAMITRFDISTIAYALATRAAEVAMALLGEPNRLLSSRRELRFRRKGSLAVVIDGAKSGQWYDHENGLGGDLINLIERVHGVTFREAVAYAEQFISSAATLATTRAPAACVRSAEDDSRRNQCRAGNLWREAHSIHGTHAACYLEWRHVLGAALEAGDGVLRFHPNCPFGEGARHPCLIAMRCDIHSDEPRAIQRIALTEGLMSAIQRTTFTQFIEASGKIARRTLGPKTGTAIKLSSDEIVTQGLTVGEGLETVLAGMVKGFRPAWALGDAGNVENFPVLGGIETLTILVDNDASGRGQRAALECSARWTRSGREVLRAVPNQNGYDFNDMLIGSAAA